MGHEAVICRNNNQQQGVEAKIAYQEEEEEDQLFVATCFVGGESNESWLIDSGCTNHMTHDKELFKDPSQQISPKSNWQWRLHLDQRKGTIAIASCKGTKHIQDVLFVPDINQNLLSVGQLIEKGFKVTFENEYCLIKDAANQDIFKVKMKGKSFSLNPLEEKQSVFALKEDETQLWHKRVGHYHHQGATTNELALDFPKLSEEISSCKACHFGKQNRKSFPKSSWRATQKLQLIHTDVAGPQRTPSLKVENESGCKIQMVRSDNGKEYVSAEFDKFCEDSGIKHQLTAPYTPQQNGVSERRNRYIMEMTRCMLHEKSLPKKFWASANRKRDKLDRRASPGVFIGYSSISKAYKIFQPQTGKIVVSRDVHFEEDEEWNFDDAEKKGQTLEKMKFKFFDSSIEEEDDRQNEIVDDASVRGTRLLSDIYERCNVAVCEPANYAEAKKDQRWIAAMEEELSMIEKNKTWILVDRPQDRKVIGVKWVFRTKLNADGSINKHKARLVVKGYAQIFGVDYSDTFAPVARMDTIRLLFAIAAQKGWKLYQLDVKSAFLNGVLQEEIYVEQPEGCEKQGERNKVYLLKKALYGLKQAPRAWYSKIDEHLLSLGFLKSLSESTLYVKHNGTNILIVSLYVDDLSYEKQCDHIQNFKWEMMKMFEMTDLGSCPTSLA
ncbi:hypothetical protein IC575_019199 [Cucumis melo]